MIKVAVCDDNTVFCNELIQYLKQNFCNDIEMIEKFDDGQELINYINDYNIVFDFILLDYKMNIMDGIDTGLSLRKNILYQNSIIFFVSSYDAPPSPVVDIHPFTYIKKPFDFATFNKKFTEALDLYRDESSYIVISNSTRTLRILAKDIIYLHSGYRKTTIHTKDCDLTLNISLQKLEKQLYEKSRLFCRANNNTIINVCYLYDAGTDYVILNDKNKSHFKLSRTYHSQFLKKCSEILFH